MSGFCYIVMTKRRKKTESRSQLSLNRVTYGANPLPDAENRKVFWLAACFAALAILVTYSNHFHNSFHFDDSHAVIENVYIRDLHNIPRFFTDATTFSSLPANQTWRPIVSLSLALDYHVGGLQPF